MTMLKPEPHQVQALAALMRAFAVHDRTTLVMPPRSGKQVRFVLPADVDEDAVRLRLVQEVGSAWERHYAALVDWAYAHPGCRVTRGVRHLGVRVGEWAHNQRAAYTQGALPAERARRLERIPHWYWDRADALWEDTYQILVAFAQQQGGITEAATGPSRFAGMHAAGSPRRRLGVWQAEQRQAYRDGTLDPLRAQRLEALPGWTWYPVPAEDLALVDALRMFVEFEKHADPPIGHIEDGLPLGRGVWEFRRRKLLEQLPPALEDEIWAATPSKWASGGGRWLWRKPETQWRLGFTALLRFLEREGHACPPVQHSEQLPDTVVGLGQWVALQRYHYHRGELDQTYIDLLMALPGWQWVGNVGGARDADEPLELPDGMAHGTPGAIARRCRCEPCLVARRTTNNEWNARRKRNIANGVPIGTAQRRIAGLERGGATRPLISLASGVPLGVIRQIATATIDRVRPEHEAALLATTAAKCLSHADRVGSRGRTRSSSLETVDASPTISLLDDLARRGFGRTWVARELGYQRALQVRQRVTRRIAEQVTQLAQRIGDLEMLPVARNQTLPSLAALQDRQGCVMTAGAAPADDVYSLAVS